MRLLILIGFVFCVAGCEKTIREVRTPVERGLEWVEEA